MRSRRRTRKWYVLLSHSRNGEVHQLTFCSFQALKWHPDRNAGSEDASKKFKEVNFILAKRPFNKNILIHT